MDRFELKWISKYREELFGIAILTVIFFHFGMLHVRFYENGSGLLFRLIKDFKVYFSSSGVDIFAFLSGVGLYYSFSSNSDIGRFYRRRFSRILIPYAVVGTIFWIQHDILYAHAGFGRFLKDFSFITFFTEGINNLWFIFFIGVMYLLFPLIYKLTFETRFGTLYYVLILSLVIIIPIVIYYHDPELYHNTDQAITRVPVFVAGIMAGKYIKKGSKVPHVLVLGIIIAGFAARYFAVQNGIKGWESRYIASFFGISAMLLFTYFLRATEGIQIIGKVLRFFGRYSLELYLLHILMWEFMGVAAGVPLHRASRWLLLVCITVLLAPLLSHLTTLIKGGRNE